MMTIEEKRDLMSELAGIFIIFPDTVLMRWQDGFFHFVTEDGRSWCEASFSKDSSEYFVIDETLKIWRKNRRGNFHMHFPRRGN